MTSPNTPLPEHHTAPSLYADDEIDLFELLLDLWQRKWLIVGAGVVALLVAVAYLLIVTPTYQVQSNIDLSPKQRLAPLTVPGVGYGLSPGDALTKVERKLASWDLRKAYFQAHKKQFEPILQSGITPEQSFETYDSKHFSLHLAQTQGNNLSIADRSTYIRLVYPKDMDGVAITNDLVAFAIAEAEKETISAFETTVQQQLGSLSHQITNLRDGYLGELRYSEAQLSDALAVAKRLGITQTTIPDGLGSGVVISNTFGNGQPTPRDGKQQQLVPLYYLGTHVLSAKLASVTRRIDSWNRFAKGYTASPETIFRDQPIDSQIADLYPLKQEGRYLSSLDPDFSKLQLVEVTRKASTPTHSVNPKKKLVLAIALVIGLMAGCLLALLSAAWKRRQEAENRVTGR